jgi:phosphatidylinositol 3,5-bisphosphate 5-phosphatase
MIGTNSDQSLYKILRIDRLKLSELDISEDLNTYNEDEYNELIEKIKEESIPDGGFNFVTNCFGIIGKPILNLANLKQLVDTSYHN